MEEEFKEKTRLVIDEKDHNMDIVILGETDESFGKGDNETSRVFVIKQDTNEIYLERKDVGKLTESLLKACALKNFSHNGN